MCSSGRKIYQQTITLALSTSLLSGRYPEPLITDSRLMVKAASLASPLRSGWSAAGASGNPRLPGDGSIPTPELFGTNVALWIMES
jgi:hypothetical protein